MGRILKCWVLALSLLSTPVVATTIDFDSINIFKNPSFTTLNIGEFRFRTEHGHLISDPSFSPCAPACAANGTQYILSERGGNILVMERIDGGLFSLNQFDGSELFAADSTLNPIGYSVIGFDTPSTTILEFFPLDGVLPEGP